MTILDEITSRAKLLANNNRSTISSILYETLTKRNKELKDAQIIVREEKIIIKPETHEIM